MQEHNVASGRGTVTEESDEARMARAMPSVLLCELLSRIRFRRSRIGRLRRVPDNLVLTKSSKEMKERVCKFIKKMSTPDGFRWRDHKNYG